MSWSGSGWYADTLVDALGTSQIGLNLALATHKLALYDNTITPNFATADQSYSATGEIVGTGYTAGGAPITSGTLTVVTATAVYMVWDGNDVQWTGSTLSGVRGGIAYADGLTPKRLILGMDFLTAYATNDGTLLVAFNANGIGRVNVISP
ncbi:hypothetical protein [Nonomuraea pusilla]|uniref:Uncharacterized protein n=1 Tax=Nonomuraea pusilla TaxID=46177 RepID=A0A1H8KAZ8_9ACTN|nr:hypothetical protein [Nonomuraea pusilla]SEN90133.1 hypothetical protein SAMN05660976_08568 [Nonomuraea pusilla]